MKRRLITNLGLATMMYLLPLVSMADNNWNSNPNMNNNSNPSSFNNMQGNIYQQGNTGPNNGDQDQFHKDHPWSGERHHHHHHFHNEGQGQDQQQGTNPAGGSGNVNIIEQSPGHQ